MRFLVDNSDTVSLSDEALRPFVPGDPDSCWLVLTHGVGMIGRTAAPLIRPGPTARGGYVPNVVICCGGIVHDRTLLLPYAVADSFTLFASVRVDALLDRMTEAIVQTDRIPEVSLS